MATSDANDTATDALELDADSDVVVSVEAVDGSQLVRVQSSSARVAMCAYVDDTATAADVEAAARDLWTELRYQAGGSDDA